MRLVVTALLLVGCAAGPAAPSEMTYLDWTSAPDGGIAAIVHPAAYYNGRVYFAYADGDGNVEIRYRENGVTSAATVLPPAGGSDVHNSPSVLVRDDGVIVWALAPHSSAHMYIGIADAAESIASFTTTDIQSTLGGTAMTYADLHKTDSGDIYLFYRDVPSGVEARLMVSKSTDGGATWSLPSLVYYDAGEASYWVSESNGSRIDIGASDGDSAVYHFYLDTSDDTWHKSDGTDITSLLPLAPSEITLVGTTSDLVRVVCSVAQDPPRIAWATRTASGATPGTYKLSTYSGGSWSTYDIATTGAAYSANFAEGDTAIATPDQVYVSRAVGGVWNMYRYQGVTGELVGGGAGPEIHPVKVRNADIIIWSNGDFDPGPGYDIFAGIRGEDIRPWTPSSLAGVQSAWPSMRP